MCAECKALQDKVVDLARRLVVENGRSSTLAVQETTILLVAVYGPSIAVLAENVASHVGRPVAIAYTSANCSARK
jgi:hypothetical protein